MRAHELSGSCTISSKTPTVNTSKRASEWAKPSQWAWDWKKNRHCGLHEMDMSNKIEIRTSHEQNETNDCSKWMVSRVFSYSFFLTHPICSLLFLCVFHRQFMCGQWKMADNVAYCNRISITKQITTNNVTRCTYTNKNLSKNIDLPNEKRNKLVAFVAYEDIKPFLVDRVFLYVCPIQSLFMNGHSHFCCARSNGRVSYHFVFVIVAAFNLTFFSTLKFHCHSWFVGSDWVHSLRSVSGKCDSF